MDLLLDTTVLIDALRGRSAVERLASLSARAGAPWTSAVDVEEIVRGVRPDEVEAAAQLLEGLRLAMPELAVEHWPVGA